MRYLKSYNEIGEANVPPFKIIKQNIEKFEAGAIGENNFFITDSGLKYNTNILYNLNNNHIRMKELDKNDLVDSVEDFYENAISLSFLVVDDKEEDDYFQWDDSVITNKGEQFRIMATVKGVVEDFIKRTPNTKYMIFGGEESEKGVDKLQRERLHIAYVKKLTDWKISKVYCEMKRADIFLIRIK